MKEIPFLLPPLPEQNQIVRFLDWKVSAINRLISIKRKQIALLHERQCVHISHIVTHGLHGHVATKNSGVEWIGDIPKHWQAMRCKYLFSERDERSQEGTEQHLSMSQNMGLYQIVNLMNAGCSWNRMQAVNCVIKMILF